MIIGSVFTLFFVPAIYVLVAKTHKKIESVDESGEKREAELVEVAV
jgi:hypothetical protein